MSRDAELIAVESQIRAAVRDCVNRTSRKPFNWGGIEGYQLFLCHWGNTTEFTMPKT